MSSSVRLPPNRAFLPHSNSLPPYTVEYLNRIASAAGLTAKGFTVGTPMACAMRSESDWSTAANTDTRSQKQRRPISQVD